MRIASVADVELLVGLMGEFYDESATPFDRAQAAAAFSGLIADPRFGRVWLIETDNRDVGYVVVTFGYSMEYGGPIAILDDLFIQKSSRGVGLGTAALKDAWRFCETLGVRAILLETGADNAIAQALYRQAGFVHNGRQLLTLKLADPPGAT